METGPIEAFYDSYVQRQIAAGVNERHHLIRDLALDCGLRDGLRVLEIGCGIGTLTSLLAEHIPNGSLLAVDLSPASIEAAIHRLAHFKQVSFRAADAVTTDLPGPFDLIVLPDVLEHIPADLHARLFVRLEALLVPEGRILIHSPEPFFSDWVRANRPEQLQVIDLALHLPALIAHVHAAGLTLHRFQRHRIWMDQPDYMALVLARAPSAHYNDLPAKPRPMHTRLAHTLRRWFT